MLDPSATAPRTRFRAFWKNQKREITMSRLLNLLFMVYRFILLFFRIRILATFPTLLDFSTRFSGSRCLLVLFFVCFPPPSQTLYFSFHSPHDDTTILYRLFTNAILHPNTFHAAPYQPQELSCFPRITSTFCSLDTHVFFHYLIYDTIIFMLRFVFP